VVTTHLYDGKKSLPLDIELYQQASSLPEGKKDSEFKKKPELALELIDRCKQRGYRPGIVLTVTATDGQTGLEKARSLIPDLIAGYTERHGVQSSGLSQQCKGKATP
jgi:SRSO17 transposase